MRPTFGNTSVRRPAVAGLFYPEDPAALRAAVSGFLGQAPAIDLPSTPKALIVPHAGYVYSGPVAAAAYACLRPLREQVKRIVLIGPSHRVYLRGAAVPASEAFATPLGDITIDAGLQRVLLARGDVLRSDEPHDLEHCLEVQLPFLQMLFADFTLLPIVVGAAQAGYVSALLEDVWGDESTLILASSDLSHYRTYEAAQDIDAATNAAILRYEATLSHDQACGATAINGLLQLAREKQLDVTEIARCNSGDTAGDRRRVVGYGAYALHPRPGCARPGAN